MYYFSFGQTQHVLNHFVGSCTVYLTFCQRGRNVREIEEVYLLITTVSALNNDDIITVFKGIFQICSVTTVTIDHLV